jgi:hypothetical protein
LDLELSQNCTQRVIAIKNATPFHFQSRHRRGQKQMTGFSKTTTGTAARAATGTATRAATILSLSLFTMLFTSWAEVFARSGITPAPNRIPKDGGGPYDRLVIRGITIIDGTGAAPEGPMDVVVEHDRIVDVVSVGVPHVPIKERDAPPKALARSMEPPCILCPASSLGAPRTGTQREE